MDYRQLSKEELQQIFDLQKKEYDNLVSQGYSVDIARGKPCNEQLDIAMPMLSAEGIENMPKSYRNYGMLDGIPEMKKIFCSDAGSGSNGGHRRRQQFAQPYVRYDPKSVAVRNNGQ